MSMHQHQPGKSTERPAPLEAKQDELVAVALREIFAGRQLNPTVGFVRALRAGRRC
jgi:hypothetical protein